ncbi:type IV pilin protein [Pseudoxanthomonas sp. SE1]|uniref:type IV pilin protein n=1 Tax=Pseudoxanthomonas sp. SE1 TaxID=1664560 RepID=UPI00240CF8BD|nr:type IV pilin protein [Pseudoxanthomonas sp. SE1]WFC42885.1 prepilin-type N-terminal cleavage/methylation domain-containing protein [Pseudoxanthomonas sp. SE1]
MITFKSGASRGDAQGFSLIELMIVVAIMAIIASIALPSYNEHLRKSRRAAGTACLLQAAQQMERLYTTELSYEDAPAAFACDGDTADFYTVVPAAAAARTYTLSATPIGRQSGDSCGTLTLNQAGDRTPGTAGCW